MGQMHLVINATQGILVVKPASLQPGTDCWQGGILTALHWRGLSVQCTQWKKNLQGSQGVNKDDQTSEQYVQLHTVALLLLYIT